VKLPAAAVPEAGYFWFFDANNVDLTVRVLDARFINGKFWVFAAALTNGEYTLQVVDTQTDVTRTYPNPPGHLTIVVDTNAFSDDGSSKAGSRPLGLYDDPAAVDGRAVDGRFWILVSSNPTLRGLAVTVTDLETQQAVTYAADDQGLLAVADNDPFAPDPPSDQWLVTPAIPGFRFQVRVIGGAETPTRQEADCIPETLCISGAVAGRSELFLRIVGPKPNGFLWPNIVKFSTSQIEVWIEQLSTGQVNYYKLDGVGPASDELTGFFDRRGFAPL
jgi:hypothetical protein